MGPNFNSVVAGTLKVLAILALLFSLGVAFIVAYTTLQSSSAVVEEGISGTIYISVAPISNNSSYLGIFGVDAQTGVMTALLDTTDGVDHFSPSIAPDGKTVAFVQAVGEHSSISFSKPRMTATEPLEVSRTFKVPVYPEFPVWNPSGTLVLFGSIPEGHEGSEEHQREPLNPDHWTIYRMNPQSGEVQSMLVGMYPLFVSENSFVFLKQDGLYQSTVEAPTVSEKVWSIIDGEGRTNMTYALSPDKSLFMWTFPDAGMVNLFSITSLVPFRAIKSVFLEKELYMPQFSPDGKFVAFLEKGDEGTKSFLVVYGVADKKEYLRVDLSRYYPQGIFISDWK